MPVTYEAALLGGQLDGSLNYYAGWINKAKLRNSEDFNPVGFALGADGSDAEMWMGGLQFAPLKDFWIQVQSTTLITDDGRTLRPVGWTGAAPGGHHREGVLAFDVPAPRPTSIGLRIVRPGESAPRTFRWQL